jgi:hypothetical protein
MSTLTHFENLPIEHIYLNAGKLMVSGIPRKQEWIFTPEKVRRANVYDWVGNDGI